MDRVTNPYTPNAGAMPPALVGRDDLVDNFNVLLARVKAGSDDKGLLVTGLRGVGKTVLLNQFRVAAQSQDAIVIFQEITKVGGTFPQRFGSLCRQALFGISPRDKWRSRAMEAARAITSFSTTFDPSSGTIKMSLGVDPAEGTADSGDLVLDLPDVVVALGRAAAEHNQMIVFLLDEIQYLSAIELSALVIAKHQINQNRLPVVFSGAGLPQLPALTGEAQTYSERMFSFPEIGKLDAPLAKLALTAPALDLGVEFMDDAVAYIVKYTDGYPFFIQEFGKAVWNQADSSPITLQDAQDAQDYVEVILDQDFFSVRTDALPEGERAYIKALASLGSGEHTQAQVAEVMGKDSSSQISWSVNRLIERGLLYRSRRGQVAFTVPHFDRYVMRTF